MKHVRYLAMALLAVSVAFSAATASGPSNWRSWGKTMDNTRYQSDETILDPGNVGDLDVKWVTQLDGNITATPAIEGSAV